MKLAALIENVVAAKPRDRIVETLQFLYLKTPMKLNRQRVPLHPKSSDTRQGFSLIELIIVILVVGVLAALVAPVILGNRENARRAQCQLRIVDLVKSLGLSLDQNQTFPIGAESEIVPIPNDHDAGSRSWYLQILELTNQSELSNQFKSTPDLNSDDLVSLRKKRLPELLCPADDGSAKSVDQDFGLSNYAGAYDHREVQLDMENSGVLIVNRPVSLDMIPDGTAYTFLIGEIRRSPNSYGWASGTRAMLRNTGSPLYQTQEQSDSTGIGGFGSYHRGGAYFGFADQHVSFINENIDPKIYASMANRADSLAVQESQF